MKWERRDKKENVAARVKRTAIAGAAALLMGAAGAIGADAKKNIEHAPRQESTALLEDVVEVTPEALTERLRNAIETEKGERFVLVIHTISGKMLKIIEFERREGHFATATPGELNEARRRFDEVNAKDRVIGIERIHTHPYASIMGVRNTEERKAFVAPPSAVDIVMAIRNAQFVGDEERRLMFNKEKVIDPVGVWETDVDATHPFVQMFNKKFEVTEEDERYPLPPGEEKRPMSPEEIVHTINRENFEALWNLFQLSRNIFYTDDDAARKELIDAFITKGKEIGITFSFTPHH